LIFAADRNLAALRPSAAVTSSFLEAALRSPRLQRVLTAGSGSTAQPHLYLKDLRQLQVPIPALGIQESLVASLREQLTFADQLETDVKVALARSERLRVSILAAAFSGKLVPQDNEDEPASILLGRITTERASSNDQMRGRTRKPRTSLEKARA
jgi:type I restriction enzyme S subunit